MKKTVERRDLSQKKRVGWVLILIGILILITAMFVGIDYRRYNDVLIYRAPIEVYSEETSILEFEVKNPVENGRLYIHIEVYPMWIGPAKVYPLLSIAMVDEGGIHTLEMNQTPGYLYLRAVGVDNSTSFTLEDIQPGKYYLLFSNAIPAKAEVKVTVAEEWEEWNVTKSLPVLLSVGSLCIVIGLFWRRIYRIIF